MCWLTARAKAVESRDVMLSVSPIGSGCASQASQTDVVSFSGDDARCGP